MQITENITEAILALFSGVLSIMQFGPLVMMLIEDW